jgi:hypothetical protein
MIFGLLSIEIELLQMLVSAKMRIGMKRTGSAIESEFAKVDIKENMGKAMIR